MELASNVLRIHAAEMVQLEEPEVAERLVPQRPLEPIEVWPSRQGPVWAIEVGREYTTDRPPVCTWPRIG